MSQRNLGGAPEGNKNAVKAKRWQKALERVLARKYGEVDAGLDALAEKLINLADVDSPMVVREVCREVAERFDGKPRQELEHSGDPENPVRLIING